MVSDIQYQNPPKSILILGSGVFGLSTAYALTQRASYKNTTITLIDRSPFPPPDASSIDSSRIIRADYQDPAYAALAATAQDAWRAGFGGDAYSESGLLLVCDQGAPGSQYVHASFENVTALSRDAGVPEAVTECRAEEDIGATLKTGGRCGNWGYLNRSSGWADAEAGMVWLRRKVEATGRVKFLTAEVTSLVNHDSKVTGVLLKTGETLSADLTVLAMGAWSARFTNLVGRVHATGQVLCYISLTDHEQEQLSTLPVTLNFSTGMFIIPPRHNILKVARHGYGYSNPLRIPNPSDPTQTITVSLPRTVRDHLSLHVPVEGEQACRQALREMIPSLGDRAFTHTRICWYTDTPRGDFLIDYHPEVKGLFVATGGSGHAYKFLPVIGEKVLDCIEDRCPMAFREKWAWPAEVVENVVTEDGSRGGRAGMMLDEELARRSRSRL